MFSILIVDDEPIIRGGLKNGIAWQKAGAERIMDAASGSQALALMEESVPDILLTDINMPKMSGLELIEEVHRRFPSVKVVVLTGHDDFEYARSCLRMGVAEFLLKPVEEEDLLDIARKLFAERKKELLEEQNRLRKQGTQVHLEKALRALLQGRADPAALRAVESAYPRAVRQSVRACVITPPPDVLGDAFRTLSLLQLCLDLVDAEGGGITTTDERGRIVIAFFAEGDSLERARQLADILEDEFDLSLQMALGAPVEDIAHFAQSYRNALDAEKPRGAALSAARLLEYGEIRHALLSDTVHALEHLETFWAWAEGQALYSKEMRQYSFELAASLYFLYNAESGEIADNRLNGLMAALAHGSAEDCKRYTTEFIRKLAGESREAYHELVQAAKSYICDHLAESISVASIAAQLYVTPNYLSKLFKRVAGVGCNEYIVQKRIEKAKGLLETTSLRTGAIAHQVGYKDNNYFSLAFKKQTGMSPTTYREKAAGENAGS